MDDRLNIVFPMGGLGTRFLNDYHLPKIYVPVQGKPMVVRVHEFLHEMMKKYYLCSYYFIMRREHLEHHEFNTFRRYLAANNIVHRIIDLDRDTGGAAETVLEALPFIDSEIPLLIHDCDQIIGWDKDNIQDMERGAGVIYCTDTDDPNFSYCMTDDNYEVLMTAEKEVISRYGAVGAYYWANGSDFVNFALRVVAQNHRTKGEYYICPIYNYAIRKGFKIIASKVMSHWHIGTPEKLREFESGIANRE